MPRARRKPADSASSAAAATALDSHAVAVTAAIAANAAAGASFTLPERLGRNGAVPHRSPARAALAAAIDTRQTRIDELVDLDGAIARLDAALEETEAALEEACALVLGSATPADLPLAPSALRARIREHDHNIEAATHARSALLDDRESAADECEAAEAIVITAVKDVVHDELGADLQRRHLAARRFLELYNWLRSLGVVEDDMAPDDELVEAWRFEGILAQLAVDADLPLSLSLP
jgi:hypothetical protein